MNPYLDIASKITPVEFELFCLEVLKAYAESEQLTDFSIIHNKRVNNADEVYQIDIYIEFSALSVKFKVLAECKQYSRNVGRDAIIILSDKVKTLGAQKGILLSTSGFQSGAIKYAKEHGIALLQIIDKNIIHIQASINPTSNPQHREYYLHSPPYYVFEYSGLISDFPDKKIYPTASMELALKRSIGIQ